MNCYTRYAKCASCYCQRKQHNCHVRNSRENITWCFATDIAMVSFNVCYGNFRQGRYLRKILFTELAWYEFCIKLRIKKSICSFRKRFSIFINRIMRSLHKYLLLKGYSVIVRILLFYFEIYVQNVHIYLHYAN